MTERTHDMAAWTALTIALVVTPLTNMSITTFVSILVLNQIGSAFPDLDQPTAEFYRELPASSLFGKLLSPLMGTHRMLSHSIIGMAIIGYLAHLLFGYLGQIILIDMNLAWWAFMLGYLSHLVMDSFTKDGVPWLFPIPIRFGFPPFRFLRIKTGKTMELIFAYPALVLLNGYLIYSHYDKFADFFSNYISK
jgi:inner membrane protein